MKKYLFFDDVSVWKIGVKSSNGMRVSVNEKTTSRVLDCQ